jgi:branched-chain amino acid transport system substrate-binding protein
MSYWNPGKLWMVLGTGALVLAGCGGATTGAPSGPATSTPYQVGLLATLSGSNARIGTDTKAGAQVAVDEIKASGGVHGHPLELVVKDEQAKADVTVSAMREFADAKIGVVLGGTVTPDCLGANPIAEQNDIAFISSSCNAITLTTDKLSKNYFQISPSTVQYANAAAGYVQKKYASIDTWDVTAYDYATGHAFWDDFKRALATRVTTAKFGKEVFFPLNTTQFAPFITSLTAAAPSGSNHGLYSFSFGGGAVSFYKQAASYKLSEHFKIILAIAGSEPTSEALAADGPQLDYLYDYYSTAYTTDSNKKFVTDYGKANAGATPDSWAYEGFTAVQAAAAAMRKAGSMDGAAVLKVLPGLHFTTAKGDVYFRASDHALVSPTTAFTCKGDGTAAKGYTCPSATPIPPAGTMPGLQ